MYAVPYIFTRDFPVAKKTTITGNQHAVYTLTTIASVKASRLSALLPTENLTVLPCLEACLFLLLRKNTEIAMDK